MTTPQTFPVSNVPTAPPCVVHSSPVGRRQRLAELGVEEELLVTALQRGLTEKLTAVIFDPRTAGGWDLYRYATRYLREPLHAAGWELRDTSNIAAVRDPVNGTILIVCAGDVQTGSLVGPQPKTKRPKGDIFLEVAEVMQTDLFGDDVVAMRRVAGSTSNVWLLLHYHSAIGSQQVLRAELSRPFEAKDGMITKWSERIVLHVPLPGVIFDDNVADDKGPVITPSVTFRQVNER